MRACIVRLVKKWLIERGGALVLLVLATYLILAPSTIVDGDNAEFSMLGAIGGRAHPSGYPAYVLFLRLTSWLPGSSAAHTGALATALLGVAAVAVLHAACRAWGARPATATIACALYAASPIVLRIHTEAEVFAMNALVAAAVLWLVAQRGPLRGAWRGFALGLVAGIGLGDHLTCGLLAPIGLLGVVRAVREAPGRRWLPPLVAVAGLAAGMATYLYLLVASGPASYGRADGLGDLVDFFLRTDYGGAGAFVAGDSHPGGAGANLMSLVGSLGRGLLWFPAIAGLAMMIVAAVRDQGERCESPWGWRMLFVTFVLAGPILVTRFNIEPIGLFRYVAQRFHLLPLLLLVPPAAVALDRLFAMVATRELAKLGAPGITVTFGALLYLAVLVVGLPRLRAQHGPAMQRGVENLLRSLPPRAIVLSQSDDVCMVSDYLEQAEGLRTDVDVVCWPLTSRTWYRARMAARGVTLKRPYTGSVDPVEVDGLLATGRPVFTDRNAHKLLASRPSYPWGITVRVLAPDEPIPPPLQLVETNRALFEKFDLDYPQVGLDDDWHTVAQRRYAATWRILSDYLAHHGSPEAAVDATKLADQLAPHD